MSKWIRELSPRDKNLGSGWYGDIDRVYRKDRKYAVQTRLIQTKIGIVEHVCIRNRDNTDIPWIEKQRIKNALFGRKRTGYAG